MDASDTQGGTYTAQSSNELTLWLDASDGGSVTKDPSTGELISWQNKINPAVEMKSWNYKPTFIDSNLSGRTGLRLYSEQGRRQGFTAYQNGRGWNPAGEKGATSGAIEDVVVMLIWRIEEFTRTSFPFNFGWGDHFPWENGHIYWRFSDNRKSVWVGNTGIPLLTTLEFSVTKGQQVVYRNGSNVLSGPRTDVRYISGSFFFPGNGGGSDYNPRFTLGEMIVLRGTMTDQEREVHEGYLAHKWGIGNTLSSSHSYRNSRPSTFDGENWEPSDSMAKLYWLDKSNQRNHATAYGSPSLDQNTQNGLNLMTYSGANGEFHEWEKINDIRTVFWVVRKSGTDSNRFLLGSRDNYNFHSNGNNYFHSGHASIAANADIRENGNSISNPQGTALPQSLSIISLRSYTELKASNFTNDRNIGGRTWKGDLGELLIFNEALEDDEIESIEGYLAHKWGLQGSLNGSHPYKSTPPDFEFGEAFVSDNGQDLEPLYYEFLHSIPAYREEDLISRWDFEEFTEDRSGLLRIQDLGPARNDGLIVGNAHLVSGKFGKALKLDGNGDYLNLPKLRGARQAKNLSFTAWINLAQTGSSDDTDDATIFSTAGLSNNHARLWYDINTDITGSRTYSLTLGSTAALFNRASGPAGLGVANQWQFLVGVMNEDSRALYLNGNSIKSASSPTSSITLQGNTGRIGSWDQDDESDFHGMIDEVRIYGTSLTQSDISALWNSGSGDLGIIPVIVMDKNHAATEVNGTIQFFQVGNKVGVTGFDSSDLTIVGATLDSLTDDGNGTFSISLIPSHPGAPIHISIATNSATGPDGSTATGPTSIRFHQSPTPTAEESLVLWYNFEGNNSKKVYDLSPRKIDATRTGGSIVPGKFSQSLSLQPGENLQVPGSDFLFNQSFTLSLWAKILDDEEGILFTNSQAKLEYRDDLKIYGSVYSGNDWQDIYSKSNPGKWAHYALTLDSTELTLFINGNWKTVLNLGSSLGMEFSDDPNLYFGTNPNQPFSMGAKILLDEVRIFDRELTNTEITKLYGSGSGDIGIRPQVSGVSPTPSSSTSQSILFIEDNLTLSVTGLDASEINASSGDILNFDPTALTYDLNFSHKPSTVRISLPYGAISQDGNQSQAGAYEFQHRTLTSVEDGLVAWYNFDQNSSSVVYDQSGNLRHGYYQSSDLSTTDNSKISTSETSSTSYTKSNAFDNNIETANDKWLAKWGGTDLWIQYDFGTPTEISSYAVYSQNADEETKSPKAWVLQGSNDNSDWGSIPSLDSRSNQVNWAEWEKRTYNLAKTENFRYYRLNFTETTGYATPTDFDDLEVWFDATDLDADGLEDTTASGTITSWFDKSANQYNAETANGTPHLNASGGPNNTPTIEIRSGNYLPINGSFFAKDHFYVFRSPAANTVWSGYGGVLGHNPASGHNQRNSNYITHHNSTYFHSNQYPSAVWRFGSQLSSPFDLDPITDYMVVRLQVNDNAPIPYSSYQIGRATGLQCNLDICEIIAFSSVLSNADADKVEGYLAHKWGLSDSLSSSHPLRHLSIGEIEFFPPSEQDTGTLGQAIELTGNPVELPFRVDQSIRSSGLSTAMWVQANQVEGNGNNPLILLSSNDGGNDWSIGIKGGLPFIRTGELELSTPQQLFSTQWTHLVAVFDPNRDQCQVYVNRVPALLNSLDLDVSSSRFVVGADPDGSNPFDGLLDDLRIWNRPISQNEVHLLYGNGMGDLGPQASFVVTSPTYGENVEVILSFNQPVYGFEPTDLTHTNLTLVSSTSDDNQTFLLSFTPTSYSPDTFTITLNPDSVSDSLGSTNSEKTQPIEYRPHRIAESELLVWWELNGTTTDSSGNGNHAIDSNPDWNSTGKFGSSLSLNSADGRHLTHGGLSSDAPEITLSAWIYPRDENFHIFAIDTAGLSWTLERLRPLFSFTNLSQTYLKGGPVDQIHGRGYLDLYKWTHLALTYDLEARRVRMYIDGALDMESSFSAASLFPLSSEFRLGAVNGINDSNGEIDDFRIYNRALSKDEIARIYGGGHGDFYNHTLEFSYPEEYQLPIPLTVKFLRDGYPVNVDGTFTDADITITSGDDSVDSPIKVSDGIYLSFGVSGR